MADCIVFVNISASVADVLGIFNIVEIIILVRYTQYKTYTQLLLSFGFERCFSLSRISPRNTHLSNKSKRIAEKFPSGRVQSGNGTRFFFFLLQFEILTPRRFRDLVRLHLRAFINERLILKMFQR